MGGKTLKQLMADEKRKKLRVKKLESELKSEKAKLTNLAKGISTKKKAELAAKKKGVKKR